MIRALEFGGFLVLAVVAHLAVVLIGPRTQGVASSGQAGETAVSIQVSDGQIADMVAQWETPPEVPEPVEAPDMPETAALNEPEVPPLEQPERPVAPAAPMAPAAPGLAVPQSDSLPDASVTAPPPPPPVQRPDPDPELERLGETRPQVRPERPDPPKQQPRREPAPKKQAKKADKPKQAAASSAAQRAAGQGQGTNAGNARQTQAATLSAGQIQSLTARWGAQVRRQIERRKRYPSAARGASGTVTVRLTVGRNGSLQGVGLARSSGNAALDQAAVRAVQSAGRFAAAPKGLTKASYTFTLQMRFNR